MWFASLTCSYISFLLIFYGMYNSSDKRKYEKFLTYNFCKPYPISFMSA